MKPGICLVLPVISMGRTMGELMIFLPWEKVFEIPLICEVGLEQDMDDYTGPGISMRSKISKGNSVILVRPVD